MYTADLEEKVDDHGVNYHAYADDRELYLRCRSEDTSTVVDTLENCVIDISQLMSANHLKLNLEKTELLWSGCRHSLSKQGSRGQLSGSAPTPSRLVIMYDSLELSCHLI